MALTLAVILLHGGLLHGFDLLRADASPKPPGKSRPSAGRWVVVLPRSSTTAPTDPVVSAPSLTPPSPTTPPAPSPQPRQTAPEHRPLLSRPTPAEADGAADSRGAAIPLRAREVSEPAPDRSPSTTDALPSPPPEAAAATPGPLAPTSTMAPVPLTQTTAADDERHALQPLRAWPAMALRFHAQRGAQQGGALLDWRPSADGSYQLHWLLALDGSPETQWSSQGHWGASGLEPSRMVETRRGRATAAVNFQRDKGIVSFSGPSTSLPMPAGAQDRVSWLLQLPLMAQALAPTWAVGDTLSLPVFTVRGEALIWRFSVVDSPQWTAPDGHSIATWHLRREPTQPYDQRVDIWLSRMHGMLPVQIQLQTLPAPGDAEPLQLQLVEGWPARDPQVDLQP